MVEVVVQLENTHPSFETRGLGYDGVVRFVKRLPEAPKHGGQGEIELGHAVPCRGVENSRLSKFSLSRHASTVTDPQIYHAQVPRAVKGGQGGTIRHRVCVEIQSKCEKDMMSQVVYSGYLGKILVDQDVKTDVRHVLQ